MKTTFITLYTIYFILGNLNSKSLDGDWEEYSLKKNDPEMKSSLEYLRLENFNDRFVKFNDKEKFDISIFAVYRQIINMANFKFLFNVEDPQDASKSRYFMVEVSKGSSDYEHKIKKVEELIPSSNFKNRKNVEDFLNNHELVFSFTFKFAFPNIINEHSYYIYDGVYSFDSDGPTPAFITIRENKKGYCNIVNAEYKIDY